MHIDKAKLEAAGIKCFTKDEYTAQVHNFYSNAIGGVKLQVLTEDVDEAKNILRIQFSEAESVEGAKIRCPYCGSVEFDTPKLNAKLSLLSTLLIGVPLPIPNAKLHCLSCNRFYKAQKSI